MEPIRQAILRTLCFHAAWRYAPTVAELVVTLDMGALDAGQTPDTEGVEGRQDVVREIDRLKSEGLIAESYGRLGLAAVLPGIYDLIKERDLYQARKRRCAGKVARWLARLGGVRFVALANTTALGSARDQGDLDFFVVARAGTLWSTRLFGTGPFKLAGLLPSKGHTRDAVCLSYFISDRALDLAPHMLSPDDPYYRYWFLSLVPLFDDGVSRDLWSANPRITRRHPCARPWAVPPDLRVTAGLRLPAAGLRLCEGPARAFQRLWFPAAIKTQMNRDSHVVVTDDSLKFHVDDAREKYRADYVKLCNDYGICS